MKLIEKFNESKYNKMRLQNCICVAKPSGFWKVEKNAVQIQLIVLNYVYLKCSMDMKFVMEECSVEHFMHDS